MMMLPGKQGGVCMFKNICVAFDGSDNAYRAFDFALELTKLCAPMQLSVVSVAVPPELPDVEASVHLDAVMNAITQDYEEHFKKLTEKAKAQNLAIKTDIRIGHAVERILEYLKENNCDMVILGKRGKSGIEELLSGSVSRSITRYAPCTVTTVK
jgi:nucleotide-binding universal stress UspA family protein